jgi:hypothetical protein
MPLTFPWSFPQGIKIYLNGRLLSHIRIAASGWHTYTFHLSQGDLTEGSTPSALSMFYVYTESRAKVSPGSGDTRQLAVAFDSSCLPGVTKEWDFRILPSAGPGYSFHGCLPVHHLL